MYKYYRPKIRSRHPSHAPLRMKGVFPMFGFKSVIRFGSITRINDSISNGGNRIELNTVNAVKNSSSKLLMKQCFHNNGVNTADWWTYNPAEKVFIPYGQGDQGTIINDLPYPIISKSLFGSRNQGNTKHDTQQSLIAWLGGKNIENYIFEKFYNYTREYRLHVNKDGCFYTCRKMLKQDTPDKDKWYRNDEHCVWIIEENPLFDKPTNWKTIVADSVKALEATGLDFGAVDVKVQSSTDKNGDKRANPKFIVIEINSAPSFGDITQQKYIEMLPQLLIKKHAELNKNEEKIKSTC